MRRRTKAISVTLSVLGGFAMVIGDVPSAVLIEGPTLAAESSESNTITNRGVAVDGNVPADVVSGLDVPTADGLKAGITDGLPPTANAGSSRVAAGGGAGGDADAGAEARRREAAAREAAARREAAEAEAEARAEAEAARRNAQADADDAEEDAREDAEDAEEDARDDADDAED